MSLLASISGIRGTIGGKPGDNLTPLDLVRFSAAYGTYLKKNQSNLKMVIGRDARPSGDLVNNLVSNTLQAMGFEVIQLGLCTTPTVEMMVPYLNACAGIILTASHNPVEWNALKMLNEKGEFISAETGAEVLNLYSSQDYDFASVQHLGKSTNYSHALDYHIEEILKLPLVDKKLIAQANFEIAVDGVNSVGGIAVPALLEALGVNIIHALHCEPTGWFAHNPEPLKENLTEICQFVQEKKCHLGIVVDPDVDRLALIDEQGQMFGEEYTLVAIADYVLQQTPGNTVSNLSSSRALHDITIKRNGSYAAAVVGEVNVVKKMKETNAVIGGEGNGGIIYPPLHYGRDSLVGIALFLTYLAQKKCTVSQLRAEYPAYFMAKHKISLTAGFPVDELLKKAAEHFKNEKVNTEDGVKVDFDDCWVHLRKSNTEPIIRIYTEAPSQEKAESLAQEIHQLLSQLI